MRQPDALGLGEALREFQALLTSVALGFSPDREAAMTYSRLRDQIMAAGPEVGVPGFVNQCASIASFRTFIGLYHFSKTARQEFLEDSFAVANRAFGWRRAPSRTPRLGGKF